MQMHGQFRRASPWPLTSTFVHLERRRLQGLSGKPMSYSNSGPLPKASFRPVSRFSQDSARRPAAVSRRNAKNGEQSSTRFSCCTTRHAGSPRTCGGQKQANANATPTPNSRRHRITTSFPCCARCVGRSRPPGTHAPLRATGSLCSRSTGYASRSGCGHRGSSARRPAGPAGWLVPKPSGIARAAGRPQPLPLQSGQATLDRKRPGPPAPPRATERR